MLTERFDLHTGLPKGDPYLGTTLGRSAVKIPEIQVHHQAPELSVVPQSERKPARLSQFREILEQGDPEALPDWLIAPVFNTRSTPPLLSVSAIERADATLSGSDTDSGLPPARSAIGLPSEPVDIDAPPENATVLGTAVHNAIERLEGRDVGQISAAVSAVLRGLSPLDAQKVSTDVVTQRLRAFAESDLWSELAAAKRAFREIDFVVSWPPQRAPQQAIALVTGKLDCLVQTHDGQWRIIDYKTGHVPLGDPAALFDHFSIQLVLYAEAVRSFTGKLPESIEIVAIGDEIRRIPLKLWKEARDAVILRIDAAIRFLADAPSTTAARSQR